MDFQQMPREPRWAAVGHGPIWARHVSCLHPGASIHGKDVEEEALAEFCPGGRGVVLSLGGVAEASTEPMNVLVDFCGCVCGITGLEWSLGQGRPGCIPGSAFWAKHPEE